jgi:hypothetical protein
VVGELGQRIYDNVSQDAFKLRLERLKMLINEYRLMPARRAPGDYRPTDGTVLFGGGSNSSGLRPGQSK